MRRVCLLGEICRGARVRVVTGGRKFRECRPQGLGLWLMSYWVFKLINIWLVPGLQFGYSRGFIVRV